MVADGLRTAYQKEVVAMVILKYLKEVVVTP